MCGTHKLGHGRELIGVVGMTWWFKVRMVYRRRSEVRQRLKGMVFAIDPPEHSLHALPSTVGIGAIASLQCEELCW